MPAQASLLPVIATVVPMAALEVYLLLLMVPREGESPTVARFVLVGAALLGSAAVLLAFLWALLYPNLNSYTILFETFGITMGFPPGLWMISIIVFRDRRLDPRSWTGPVTVAALATGGELLMGLLLVYAGGPPSGPLATAAATTTSPWYVGSMGAAMVALLLWVRGLESLRVVLGGLTASGLVAPLVPIDPVAGAAVSGGIMILTLSVLALAWRRGDREWAKHPTLILAAFGGFLGMSLAGLVAAGTGGATWAVLLYGGVSAAIMGLELAYLLRAGFLTLRAPVSSPSPTSAAFVAASSP